MAGAQRRHHFVGMHRPLEQLNQHHQRQRIGELLRRNQITVKEYPLTSI
jgi:hypothetical protein